MGVDARRATEGPADVLNGTSRNPTERNAADMPGSAAAVEASCIMRVNFSYGLNLTGRPIRFPDPNDNPPAITL
jgi:hypothetical protein